MFLLESFELAEFGGERVECGERVSQRGLVGGAGKDVVADTVAELSVGLGVLV